MWHYWKLFGMFFISTAIIGAATKMLLTMMALPVNIFAWILEGVICTIIVNLFFFLVFRQKEEFTFFKNKVMKILKKG
jgi:hypothetical protein